MFHQSKLDVLNELPIHTLKNLKTEDFQIYLPIKPIGKGRPRFTRKGHAYTPQKTRDAENIIAMMLRSQTSYFMNEIIEGPFHLDILFVIKKPKSSKNEYPIVKPDIDNILKLIGDSGNGHMWHDDCQIVSISTAKIYEQGKFVEGIYLSCTLL